MKSALHFSLFSILLFLAACSKKNDATDTLPPPVAPTNTDTMKYIVNGLTDWAIGKSDSLVIPLSIVHTGGRQENLDLSVTGLPSSVTANFQASSGIPAYATTLTLKSNQATPGDYPIKLVATPASGGAKEFEINLHVNEVSYDCVQGMGDLYSYKSCGGEVSYHELRYEAPNKLKSRNLFRYGDVVFIIDCDSMKVTTHKVYPDGTTITGSGTIIDDSRFTITIESNRPQTYPKCWFEFTRR